MCTTILKKLRFLNPNLKCYHQPQLSPPHLITSAETTHPQAHRIMRLEHWCIFNILISCIQTKDWKGSLIKKEHFFVNMEYLASCLKKPGNKDFEPCYLTLKMPWKTVCCLVAKSYITFCHPMDCSTPGFPFLPCLPEFDQIHVHWVSDAI